MVIKLHLSIESFEKLVLIVGRIQNVLETLNDRNKVTKRVL